jgi:hypothetical protein
MEYLSTIADIIGVLGAIFAFFAWLKARQIQKELQHEQQRQSRKITVILNYGPKPLELPVQIRRIELTRAEILGRIGMLPMKNPGARFSLGYINKPEFLQRIYEITGSTGDTTLTIPCTKEEFEQFDLP